MRAGRRGARRGDAAPFIDAGFTEIALVQIGGETQEAFIRWAEKDLLPALREM